MKNAKLTKTVSEFCALCGRVYKAWLFHQCLFRVGFEPKHVKNKLAKNALIFISEISQENLLLGTCRLHDPAVQGKNKNLTIDYIIEFGDWDDPTKQKLLESKTKLDRFAKKLKPLRNKGLSHHDLQAILDGATLGAFPSGEDTAYFRELENFANIAHTQAIGWEYRFDKATAREATALLELVRQKPTYS